MLYFWLLLIFPLLWGIGAQQRLYAIRLEVRNQLRELRVELSQRYNLIPHFAEALAGYLKHEREHIEQLVVLRSQAVFLLDQLHAELDRLKFYSLQPLIVVEAQIRRCLAHLIEKAQTQQNAWVDPNVQRWLQQINTLSESIFLVQQNFNRSVLRFNLAADAVPANLIAWLMRYSSISTFEPDAVRLPNL